MRAQVDSFGRHIPAGEDPDSGATVCDHLAARIDSQLQYAQSHGPSRRDNVVLLLALRVP
jgi:hypothetical protein